MKERLTEAQIVGFLREADAGIGGRELFAEVGGEHVQEMHGAVIGGAEERHPHARDGAPDVVDLWRGRILTNQAGFDNAGSVTLGGQFIAAIVFTAQ